MSNLSPMTPADCDLRGLPFMPLDVVRLVDSDLAALSTGEEFKAAVILWCKSWLQVPAGSLPTDDRILAKLSGTGHLWRKVKDMALRGWVLCSDGRLYHPVVAEKARDAWHHRLAQRERAARRWKKDSGTAGTPDTGNATAYATASPAAHANGHAKADAAAYPTAMQGTGTVKGEGSNPPLAPPAGGAKKRGRELLPSDWKPNEKQRLVAANSGLDPGATALNFLDYCLGQGRRLADIDAAWRVWCRVAASASNVRKRPLNNGLLELHRRIEAGEDVVGSLLAEMEAERGTTH